MPVSQCIEVDPREPHSITITFVPANLSGSSNVSNESNTNNISNVSVAPQMTDNNTNNNANDNHTAPIA